MDALTHAVIGVAVGSFSGHPFSLHDPVYLASLLASQAPDLDILTRAKGPVAYLKHHRAFSHSLPGLLLWSSVITGVLLLVYPSASPASIFFWSLLGGLSHTITDFFNTHGSSILWPIRKERKSCHILNVFDPLLLALLLIPHLFRLSPQLLAISSMFTIILYVAARHRLKQRSAAWLRASFSNSDIRSVLLMPCLTRLFYWDFLLKTGSGYLVGRIGVFSPVIRIHARLPLNSSSALSRRAQSTAIGRFFATFTPFSYFEEYEEAEKKAVRIYDLRYYKRKQFVHSGTIVFTDGLYPSQSYMESYGSKIQVRC